MATFYENLGDSFNRTVLTHIQSDGKILCTGWFTTLDNIERLYNCRLNSDGTEDSSWYTNFSADADDKELIVCLNSSDEIFVFSEDGGRRPYIKKYSSTGVNDTTFETNQGTGGLYDSDNGNAYDCDIHSGIVQSDGKIVIAGLFSSWNGTSVHSVLRFNTNGTIDTTFATNIENYLGGGKYEGRAYGIDIQSDGKIVICGSWREVGTDKRIHILRFNSNGTPDNTFINNIAINDVVFSPAGYWWTSGVKVQSDGKILFYGWFNSYNNNNAESIVRLNSDGTEDSSFTTNLGTGIHEVISSCAIQSDGKIIVGGWISELNGVTKYGLIRLNSDGTEDTGFTTGIGGGMITYIEGDWIGSINVLSDGKIIISGWFTSFDGRYRKNIVKLNSDGTENSTGGTLPTTNFSSIQLNGRNMTTTIVNETNIIPIEDINYINSARVPDSSAPGVATSLSASGVCNDSFYLSWTAPSDNDIAGYRLQRESAPSTWETWKVVYGAQTVTYVNGVTPGSTNDWALITVDQEGNESSRSTAVTVKQGQEVLTCEMTTSGSGSASTACADSTTTTRYYYGTVLAPVAGDIIYTDSCGTTKLNGGGKYYKLVGFIDYSFQVSSTGVISNVATC